MHGPSFFSLHPFSFSISFPKLTIFTILRLYMACKMWKITALTWEISSCRLVEKFHVFAFPISLYNWIGEHEITKHIKNIYLLRIQKKGHKNKHKMTRIKTKDTKRTIWYFQQCACVNTIYFASVVTTRTVWKTTRALKWVSLLERVRNCEICSTLVHT